MAEGVFPGNFPEISRKFGFTFLLGRGMAILIHPDRTIRTQWIGIELVNHTDVPNDEDQAIKLLSW